MTVVRASLNTHIYSLVYSMKEITEEEREYILRTNSSVELCMSKDSMEEWVEGWIGNSKLYRKNTVKEYHDMMCGEWVRNPKNTLHWSLSEYSILQSLASIVYYRSMIIIRVQELCSLLSCRDNHLQRKLTPLVKKGMLRLTSSKDGMKNGEIKIHMNPTLVWVHEYQYFSMTREEAIKSWYRRIV